MRVLVTRPIPEAGMDALWQGLGRNAVEVSAEDRPILREELLRAVAGKEGLLTHLTDRIDAEVMDAAGPQLKVVANFAVGYDNIDIAEAARRGITVSNTPGVLTEATADLTWVLLLGAARRAGEGERCLRGGQWAGWGPRQFLGVPVYGRTLGIFGMGRIGQAVARRAAGFSMRVLYTDQHCLESALEQQLNAEVVDRDTLLRESDFLSIHCPMTPETRHAFTLAEFRKMKPTAVLINTARGPIVQEEDLVQALDQGLLFAAGLDVYEFEPRVHPGLLQHERVLLLPHLGSATMETRSTMARMAAENIVAVLCGMPAPNAVGMA